MVDAKKQALFEAMVVVTETVAEAGVLGAPSGVMYAGLMGVMSLDSYQNLMGACVSSGLMTLRGHCYHITPKGREFVSKVAAARAQLRAQDEFQMLLAETYDRVLEKRASILRHALTMEPDIDLKVSPSLEVN